MFKILKSKKFFENEDGAVTVDWVVLTGAIVGVAVAGVTSTQNATVSAASAIAADISAMPVP